MELFNLKYGLIMLKLYDADQFKCVHALLCAQEVCTLVIFQHYTYPNLSLY